MSKGMTRDLAKSRCHLNRRPSTQAPFPLSDLICDDDTGLVLDMYFSLDQLVARFPIDGYAQGGKCKCLQFEDHEWCRHLEAVEVLVAFEHKMTSWLERESKGKRKR